MTTVQSLKIRKRFRSVLYQIVAIAIGILLVTPILYALVISFMPGEDILTIPPRFIPSRWITDNYKMAWTLTTLPRFMLNSLILAGVSSVVRVITASMAAFALSFFEFRGRNVIFMLMFTDASPFYKIFVNFLTDLTAALKRNDSECASRDCF